MKNQLLTRNNYKIKYIANINNSRLSIEISGKRKEKGKKRERKDKSSQQDGPLPTPHPCRLAHTLENLQNTNTFIDAKASISESKINVTTTPIFLGCKIKSTKFIGSLVDH
jgi:hypothetical protein